MRQKCHWTLTKTWRPVDSGDVDVSKVVEVSDVEEHPALMMVTLGLIVRDCSSILTELFKFFVQYRG